MHSPSQKNSMHKARAEPTKSSFDEHWVGPDQRYTRCREFKTEAR